MLLRIITSAQGYIWNVDNDLIKDTYSFDDTFRSLGLDSLDVVTIVDSFELEYHIEITNSEALNLKTPNDLVKLVESKCQKN